MISFLAAALVVAPSCAGSLSQWTATLKSTDATRTVLLGVRAEGECAIVGRLRAWGRADVYELPSKAGSATDTISSVEAWVGASYPVFGTFSLAVFAGKQTPIESGTLGLGQSTLSFCGGGRIDSVGTVIIGGLCSNYAPVRVTEYRARVDQTKPLGRELATVATIIVPLRDRVKFATNLAVSKRDWLVAFGPTIGF